MCLHAILQIVETGVVRNLPGKQVAGQVLHSIGQTVPLAVKFFGSRIGGRLDGMSLFHERVQIYELKMVVQCFKDGIASDAHGERRYRREDCSFRHFGFN